MPVLPFTWTAAFVLANERVEITVASSHLNPEPYVSFTGNMGGGAGQIVDSLRSAAEGLENASDITDICDAWDALHLKRIPDLDAAQIALLDSVESLLVIANGERYGSAPDKLEDIEDADFSNTSDIIDSRDVIKRIETLAAAFEAAGLDPDKLDPASPDYDAQGLEEEDPAHDVAAELKALRDLESEGEEAAATGITARPSFASPTSRTTPANWRRTSAPSIKTPAGPPNSSTGPPPPKRSRWIIRPWITTARPITSDRADAPADRSAGAISGRRALRLTESRDRLTT
jgi:hypothetical protein